MAYSSLTNHHKVFLSVVPACAILISFMWYSHRQQKRRTLSNKKKTETSQSDPCNNSESVCVQQDLCVEKILSVSQSFKDNLLKVDFIEDSLTKLECAQNNQFEKTELLSPETNSSQFMCDVWSDTSPSSSDSVNSAEVTIIESDLHILSELTMAQENQISESTEIVPSSDSIVDDSSETSKRGSCTASLCADMEILSVSSVNSSVRASSESEMTSDDESQSEGSISPAFQQNNESEDLNVLPHLFDSANHSPEENMLSSPAISTSSKKSSDASTYSDSGKGGSDVEKAPVPQEEVENGVLLYQFSLQQYLIGKLIGHRGVVIRRIMRMSNTEIVIKRHPTNRKFKLVDIEGYCKEEIDQALSLIEEVFPPSQFPQVQLEACHTQWLPAPIALMPGSERLFLIEDVCNDVSISSLLSAGHLFLQQPTHPTHRQMDAFFHSMQLYYSENEAPIIDKAVVAKGLVSVVNASGGWHRVEVTEVDGETCDVRLVDYGGYINTPISALRQIRMDLLALPFQASECYLDAVTPADGSNVWSEAANQYLYDMCSNQVLQATVSGYAENKVPYICLYRRAGEEIICVNQELIDMGLASYCQSYVLRE